MEGAHNRLTLCNRDIRRVIKGDIQTTLSASVSKARARNGSLMETTIVRSEYMRRVNLLWHNLACYRALR
jgi:hypothetical protein